LFEDRMIGTVDREGVLERCIDQAVVERPTETLELLRDAKLDAHAAGVADIVEEADVRLCSTGGLEQNVVAIECVEGADVPAHSILRATAQAELCCACDHLVERRIGQERVRQVARRVGARACKLDGCRRARRFADVGVQRRRLPQTVRETERRIETLETMPAIELRRGTRSIVQANARRIEAAGYRQMRAVRQRQPVREISARNRHLALDVCEKLLDENARARSGTILKQARYFCHRMERRTTFLERDAYEQVVGPTGELRAPAQLQRPTIAILPAAADVVDRIQLLAVH